MAIARFKAILAILLGLSWCVVVEAQISTAAPAPSSTASAAAVTHTFAVGQNGGFLFTPNTTTANIGDIIEFDFWPSNHSVARAAYGFPCLPIEDTMKGSTGFWSGFQPTTLNAATTPRYSVRVNDTAPIFFYCSAPGACLGDHMIGVINPNRTQTLDGQLAAVLSATQELSPGEAYGIEGVSTPAASGTTATTSSAPLAGGAIAGIVVGVLVLLTVAGLMFYLCGRNRTLASVIRYSRPPQGKPSNIPQPEYDGSPMAATHSPSFSMAKSHQSPTLVSHHSWQSSTYPQRTMSPEYTMQMAQHYPQQAVAPLINHLNSPYEAPRSRDQRPSHIHLQSSPSEAPWSPNGFGLTGSRYEAIPQDSHQHMSTSNPHSAGSPQSRAVSPQMPIMHATFQGFGPHELDSQSITSHPLSSPPDYDSRTFSFREGDESKMG